VGRGVEQRVPGWLQVLGAVGLVLSFYVLFLTFRENAYLALVVKVQEERGQTVVTSGPYRYVRHPMYASMFLFFPGCALLLGSWWGLLLCLMILGLLIWRTTLEDRMLKNELAGYDEYARQVRYRLIPRVW
jgi:protein-S-isoprenylcysteine O-methyltransferase Ste14